MQQVSVLLNQSVTISIEIAETLTTITNEYKYMVSGEKWMEKEIIALAASFFKVPEASLSKTTSLYSLSDNAHDIIKFIFTIEKKFNVEFEDVEVEKIKKIRDIVKLVKSKTTPTIKKAA